MAEEGLVVQWNADKGYGFIQPDVPVGHDGRMPVFCHMNAVQGGALFLGRKVRFTRKWDEAKGKPYAADVSGTGVQPLDPVQGGKGKGHALAKGKGKGKGKGWSEEELAAALVKYTRWTGVVQRCYYEDDSGQFAVLLGHTPIYGVEFFLEPQNLGPGRHVVAGSAISWQSCGGRPHPSRRPLALVPEGEAIVFEDDACYCAKVMPQLHGHICRRLRDDGQCRYSNVAPDVCEQLLRHSKCDVFDCEAQRGKRHPPLKVRLWGELRGSEVRSVYRAGAFPVHVESGVFFAAVARNWGTLGDAGGALEAVDEPPAEERAAMGDAWYLERIRNCILREVTEELGQGVAASLTIDDSTPVLYSELYLFVMAQTSLPPEQLIGIFRKKHPTVQCDCGGAVRVYHGSVLCDVCHSFGSNRAQRFRCELCNKRICSDCGDLMLSPSREEQERLWWCMMCHSAATPVCETVCRNCNRQAHHRCCVEIIDVVPIDLTAAHMLSQGHRWRLDCVPDGAQLEPCMFSGGSASSLVEAAKRAGVRDSGPAHHEEWLPSAPRPLKLPVIKESEDRFHIRGVTLSDTGVVVSVEEGSGAHGLGVRPGMWCLLIDEQYCMDPEKDGGRCFANLMQSVPDSFTITFAPQKAFSVSVCGLPPVWRCRADLLAAVAPFARPADAHLRQMGPGATVLTMIFNESAEAEIAAERLNGLMLPGASATIGPAEEVFSLEQAQNVSEVRAQSVAAASRASAAIDAYARGMLTLFMKDLAERTQSRRLPVQKFRTDFCYAAGRVVRMMQRVVDRADGAEADQLAAFLTLSCGNLNRCTAGSDCLVRDVVHDDLLCGWRAMQAAEEQGSQDEGQQGAEDS